MNRRLVAALAVACSLSVVVAQKVALTDGSDRQVVILEVADLLPEKRFGIAGPPKRADRFAAVEPTSVQRLAAFVRTFVPALAEPGADVQPLGDSHLVVLGSPVQVAAAQGWLVKAREAIGQQFQIDVRVCDVTATVFDRDVAPLFAKAAVAGATTQHTAALDREASTPLLAALKKASPGRFTQFPQVVSPCLHRAKLMVGKHVEYVRDFEIEVATAAFGLVPVKDTVFDGHDIDVMVAKVADGALAVQMQLVDQVVEQPLREVTTTVPGTTQEVTVQTPRVNGCRGSMTVEMADGATAVMAARKTDGSWLVTLMTVQEVWSGPRPPARR